MGTKQIIGAQVAEIIADGPPGPLLDLFSGMCAIGTRVVPARQVWNNDIQVFASTVAKAFFTSPELPLHFDQAAELVRPYYLENCKSLEARFAEELKAEDTALSSDSASRIAALERKMPNIASDKSLWRERARLAKRSSLKPYRLFTITYSGGYLGLRQCIQVDGIRCALDQLRHSGMLDQHQHRWMCLALCQAVSKVSTTTGHFAQYMRVKDATVGRFLAQRSRSVWREWLRAIFECEPLGSPNWRSRNKVFNRDATPLLYSLLKRRNPPAVIYADPPYTSDHYSRYYHLYETLLLYDYPPSLGTGRYRPDRFPSRYSVKTEVESAMNDLIRRSSRLGSRLVLSYPEQGLLPDARSTITRMIRQHFGNGGLVACLDHLHSSLGGSKGAQKYKVREMIFAAA